MNRLLFPWDTGKGLMTGYHAEPEVDAHFLALVARKAFDWRSEAGVHPQAQLGDVSGEEVMSIGLMMTSIYLKHIRFVMLAKKKHPEISLEMSLTIWKRPNELTESISNFTGIDARRVESALGLFTLDSTQLEYFAVESTPYIPMLIRVSEGYLLAPISSIFRNPFEGVRMSQETKSNGTKRSIREPREAWMASDLTSLFEGGRYTRVRDTVRLTREGQTVTDIDAAILDRVTGELALFQLKWQDFSTQSVKRQKSKAKNFVTQVDSWSARITEWVKEFGVGALCRSLRLPVGNESPVVTVRLFAIGRAAARFQSYGHEIKDLKTAVGTWPQFIRLRVEIGASENVFSDLHRRLGEEKTRSIDRRPLPHEILVGGQKILFEDLWSEVDEDGDGPS